ACFGGRLGRSRVSQKPVAAPAASASGAPQARVVSVRPRHGRAARASTNRALAAAPASASSAPRRISSGALTESASLLGALQADRDPDLGPDGAGVLLQEVDPVVGHVDRELGHQADPLLAAELALADLPRLGGDGLRDAVEGEVAGDVPALVAAGDLLALEDDLGELLRVEEVAAA